MCQTSRLLSWPRAQGLLRGSSDSKERTANSSILPVWRCRRKVASVRKSHFHSALVKNAASRGPAQGSRVGTFVHSSPWYPALQCEDGEPWSRSEQSHLSSFTERLMRAKELYFCKRANDRSSTGMVRASPVNHPAVLLRTFERWLGPKHAAMKTVGSKQTQV